MEYTDIYIDNLQYKTEDDDIISINFNMHGLEKYSTTPKDDGVSILVYSKISSTESRYLGMFGTGFSGPKGEIFTDFKMYLPEGIKYNKGETIYIKLFYFPGLFADEPVAYYPDTLMFHETIFEIAKLKFPLNNFRGAIDE